MLNVCVSHVHIKLINTNYTTIKISCIFHSKKDMKIFPIKHRPVDQKRENLIGNYHRDMGQEARNFINARQFSPAQSIKSRPSMMWVSFVMISWFIGIFKPRRWFIDWTLMLLMRRGIFFLHRAEFVVTFTARCPPPDLSNLHIIVGQI